VTDYGDLAQGRTTPKVAIGYAFVGNSALLSAGQYVTRWILNPLGK
jgi:hypothetical protein